MSENKRVQPELNNAQSPTQSTTIQIEDPIIDILRDDFEFEDDFVILFSAAKCSGSCPDC